MTNELSEGILYDNLCKRCNKDLSVVISRSEAFCKSCFLGFVHIKLRKELESFKVNYSQGHEEQHLLLPLSFGRSSIALLDMVVELIRIQKSIHRGRQGFYLHAIHVESGSENGLTSRFADLEKIYPECKFACVNISEFFSPGQDMESIVVNESGPANVPAADTDLNSLLDSLPDKSSRKDFIDIIRKKVIISHAYAHGFQTVIWGHSMTRLAELTLSLTAKGRGNDIAAHTRAVSHGSLTELFPLGNIMIPEVEQYLSLKQLNYLVTKTYTISASTKNMTIDELVGKYFESIEASFPSIVSTVVRTSSKLADISSEPGIAHCRVCDGPLQKDAVQWAEKITSNAPAPLDENDLIDNLQPESNGSTPDEICHGCIVMFKGASFSKLSFPTTYKADVLSEYLI